MQNPLFINTRPSHKISHKTLGNLPMTIANLPLLAIRHFDKLTETEQASMSDFIAGKFGVLVVVSVEAVRCAIRHLKAHGIDHATAMPHRPAVIAVGEPTAIALRAFGFAVITPTEHGLPMSNEGMIQLPIFDTMGRGGKVLIWRGVSGRRLLHDELTKKGISVQAIEFYERGVPSDLPENFYELSKTYRQHSPIFVLITSQMSLEAWRGVYDKLLKNEPSSDDGFLPKNMIYLTLGERLTSLTKTHYPNSNTQLVANLDDDTLNQTICQYLNFFKM